MLNCHRKNAFTITNVVYRDRKAECGLTEQPLAAFLRPTPEPEQLSTAAGKHIYRDDGLLQVNPDAPHPIFNLMERSEAAWNKKLKRASKKLDDAVAEYERRYKRLPPLGFDQWYVLIAFDPIVK